MEFEEWYHLLLESDSVENAPVTEKDMLFLFTSKWAVNVTLALLKTKRMRYGELRRAIPNITNTMLAKTLQSMVELGIVQREQFNEIPPHTEYTLTEAGCDLVPVFYVVTEWQRKHLSQTTRE